MTDFPEMTPAQSIKFMLTLPWVMGDNSEDGAVSYDASEIETVIGFVDKLSARAEAAEADARECRAERARYGDAMTEQLAAAEAERDAAEADLARTEDLLGVAQDERDAARTERDEARSDYRLLIERVKAVTPYAINTAAWVTLLVTIGIEPEDMHFNK